MARLERLGIIAARRQRRLACAVAERGLSQTAARRQPDQRFNYPKPLPFLHALRVGTTRAPAAIQKDEAPSFYFMQYDLATWSVRNLVLVPHFAFPPSAIIKRKPLSVTARRAGWIGCNFALNRIPVEARIAVVTEKEIIPETEVREKFKRVKPLKDISVKQRGWTLDVLNIVRRLGKPEFTNEDIYVFTRELEQLHPDNRHVRDRIRQQLQVLRDLDLLQHAGPGLWRLP